MYKKLKILILSITFFAFGSSLTHGMLRDEHDDLENKEKVKTFFSQNGVELTDEFVSDFCCGSREQTGIYSLRFEPEHLNFGDLGLYWEGENFLYCQIQNKEKMQIMSSDDSADGLASEVFKIILNTPHRMAFYNKTFEEEKGAVTQDDMKALHHHLSLRGYTQNGPTSPNKFGVPHMYYDAAFFFYNKRRGPGEFQPLEALFGMMPREHRPLAFEGLNAFVAYGSGPTLGECKLYRLRLMSQNPPLEDLNNIQPGEMGLFSTDKQLYCKTHDQGNKQIEADKNPKIGLFPGVYNRFLARLADPFIDSQLDAFGQEDYRGCLTIETEDGDVPLSKIRKYDENALLCHILLSGYIPFLSLEEKLLNLPYVPYVSGE